MTGRKQAAIPKRVGEALRLAPADRAAFDVSRDVRSWCARPAPGARVHDRCEAARGKAQVKWRTDGSFAPLHD